MQRLASLFSQSDTGRKQGRGHENQRTGLQNPVGYGSSASALESWKKSSDKEIRLNNRPESSGSQERGFSELESRSECQVTEAVQHTYWTPQSSDKIPDGSSPAGQTFCEHPLTPAFTSVPPSAVPFASVPLAHSMTPALTFHKQNMMNLPPLYFADVPTSSVANTRGFNETHHYQTTPQAPQYQFIPRQENIRPRSGEQPFPVTEQQSQTLPQFAHHTASPEGEAYRNICVARQWSQGSGRTLGNPEIQTRTPNHISAPLNQTAPLGIQEGLFPAPETGLQFQPHEWASESQLKQLPQQVQPADFQYGLQETQHNLSGFPYSLTSPQIGTWGSNMAPHLQPYPLLHFQASPAMIQPNSLTNPPPCLSDFHAVFPGAHPFFGASQFMNTALYPHPMNMLPVEGQHLRRGRPGSCCYFPDGSVIGSENETGPQPRTIKIRGVKDAKMVAKCKYYFQNPDRGGGETQNVKWDNIENIYYIEFADVKVARRVVSSIHKLDGEQLEISFAPAGIPTAVGMRTVQISGGDTEFQDVYKLYFENPQNGGGPISRIWLDRTHKLFITFEDATAAETVCSRQHKVEDRVLEARLASMEHVTGVTDDVSEMDEAWTMVEAAVGQHLKDETFYRQYFETCQGGGPVKELILNEENGTVMVTFDNPKVAQQVSSGRHMIDGADVQVSILRRPPFYSDRLLLKNVARGASKELLMKHLEIVSGQDGIVLVYSDDQENVVAVFAKKIDFPKIQEKCQVKLLCGRRVQVCRVPVSNCIFVENLSPVSSNDAVACYFESPRAAGGTILKVQLAEEHSRYVFFEDPEVIQRVMVKKHFLGGRELRVRLYLECLGPSGGKEDPYVFLLPEPLELSARDNIKIRFLQHCSAMLQVFNEHLSKVYANARIVDDVLRIECSLKERLPKVHLLVSAWNGEVNKQLEICFDLVSLDRQEVMPEIWPEVKKGAEGSEISKNELVLTCQEENAIVVLSRCSTGGNTFKKIQAIVADAEKEFTFKKLEVSETTTLRKYELDLLTMSSFLSDAKEQCSRLRVDVREEEGEITFHGQLTDIKDAQTKMLKILRSATSEILTDLTDSKIKLLASEQSRNLVDRNMKQSGLIATWDCRKEGVVTVYCVKESDIRRAVHVIQTSLRQEDLKLNEVSLEIMASQNWKSLRNKLIQEKYCTFELNAENNSIRITAISDIMDSVKTAVQSFIAENTICSAVFRFSPSRQKFLALFWEDMLAHIAGKLSQYRVQITLDNEGETIHVKGIKEGLGYARKELESLDGRIVYKEEIITRKEALAFLLCPDSTREVDVIARAHKCVLSRNPEEKGIQVVSTSQQAAETRWGENQCLVSAVLTDITHLPVDAIVNAANERMQHGGGLAGAIVSKGGREIQEECYRLLRTRGPLSEGDVLVSGPGKLPCKAIMHAVGPRYKGGNKGERECLRTTVLRSLQTASERGFTSIALPAISSGIFGYPVDEATRVIVEAVRVFLDTNLDTSIRDVRLCDIQQKTVDLFQIALDATSVEKNSATINHDSQLRSSEASALSAHTSGIKVSVVEGEIAKQTADAIVNSTSNDLRLEMGAISSSILEAAGPGLQKECSLRYPDGIRFGGIAFTESYNLACKAVFHVALCRWNTEGATEQLKSLVEECLKEATSRQFSSMALPALGTGNLGFPRDVVARTFLTAIDQFQQTSAKTSLKEVKIVVFNDQKMLEAFDAAKRSETESSFFSNGTYADVLCENSALRLKETIQEAASAVAEDFFEESIAMEMGSRADWITGGATSRPGPSDQGDSTGAFDFGDLHLIVKQGDITEQDVDAIVNSSNAQLDLSRGAVSTVLMARCGQGLQHECDTKRGDMGQQTTVLTAAYNLKCRHIIHIDAEYYNSVHDWEKAYTVLLQTAEKAGMSSLAVPALGTGNYHLPPASSAQALAKALGATKQTTKTLRTVSVVLFDSNTVRAFVDTLKGEANKSSSLTLGNSQQTLHKKSFWQRTFDKLGGAFRSKRNTIPDAFQLYIFTTNQDNIKTFLKGLHDMVNAKYKSKKIKDLKKISQEEREEIAKACESFHVDLHWDEKKGTAELKGMDKDVEKITEMIHNLLREVEREHQEAVVANAIQWHYLESKTTGTERTAFGKRENLRIEEAFQAFQNDQTKDSVEITDDKGQVRVITFTDRKMSSKLNPSDSVKIMRQEIIKDGAISPSLLPQTWDIYEGDPVKLVPLQSGCAEYDSVYDNFSRTAGGTYSIRSIERIQNPELYVQYSAKKKQMEKQNSRFLSEMTLWHGTSADTLQNINSYGFNRSFCGKNAVYYGQGVYFAANSAYSIHNTYSPPDVFGNKYVYQCKVLVGYSTRGDPNMRTLPIRQGGIPYDSATNDENRPILYVIFHDSQAYPEYLIKFTQTP